MKKRKLTIYIFIAILIGMAVIIFTASKSKSQVSPSKNKGQTLIELFTSEGCSSCPKADKTVAELQDKYKDKILVLCYHVDYWNYLGWKDAYSSHPNTERQEYYAGIFHLNSTYTPQAVVNGKKEMVGSDRTSLVNEIESPKVSINNTTINLHAYYENGVVNVSGSLSNNKEETLIVCLVQKHATTHVKRGENEGSTLSHINLVRDFTQSHGAEIKYTFKIPDGLTKQDLFIAAYLQNINTGVISLFATTNVE